MNLLQLFESRGREAYRLHGKHFDMRGRKVVCPFHDDNNPSAMVNENGLYCFVCDWHSIKEIAQFFRVAESSIDVSGVDFGRRDDWGVPLFWL